MPFRWEEGDLDPLKGSEKRSSKRGRGESGSAVDERHYATGPVTWCFAVEEVTYGEVRDVVLAHALLNNVDTIDNDPPSTVAHEDLNQGGGEAN